MSDKFQTRKNAGKKRVATLVGLGALEAIASAGEVGLVKYWRDGYREDGGYSFSQCLDSAVRHILLRTGGQKYDTDGSAYLGRPLDHLDCAIWNLAAAAEARRLYGDRNDDLWKGPGTVIKGEELPAADQEQISLADLVARVEKFLPEMKEEHREPAQLLIQTLKASTSKKEKKK